MSGATETAAAGIVLSQSTTPVALSAGGLAQLAAVFFVAMGLHPEHLFAGMWGALAGIVMLGNVPLEKDTIGARVNQAFERLILVVVCAVMAGYTTPFLGHMLMGTLKVVSGRDADWHAQFLFAAQMFTAFVVGAGGRKLLSKFIQRYERTIEGSAHTTPPTTGQL